MLFRSKFFIVLSANSSLEAEMRNEEFADRTIENNGSLADIINNLGAIMLCKEN